MSHVSADTCDIHVSYIGMVSSAHAQTPTFTAVYQLSGWIKACFIGPIRLSGIRGGRTSLELSLIMTTFQPKLLFVFADSAVASTMFLLVSYFSRPLKAGRPNHESML